MVKRKYYTAKLVLYIGLKKYKNCFKLICKISVYRERNYLVILNYQLPLMGKPLPRYPRIDPPPPPFNSIVEKGSTSSNESSELCLQKLVSPQLFSNVTLNLSSILKSNSIVRFFGVDERCSSTPQ